MNKVHWVIVILITLVKEKYAQTETTAVITPRGYNASLDPESSFTIQCDVTGADSVQWLVDGLLSTRQDIRSRGISESDVVIVDETAGRFRANLSLTRNTANRNSTIICLAYIVLSPAVPSDPVLFQIQGLLDSPPNLILSDVNCSVVLGEQNFHMRRLSWDEPFSLDITDVDPDISHYSVCYRLVNTNRPQCAYLNQTEFTFLYVNIPLLFTVSAVNVVGEGSATSIHAHQTIDCERDLSNINESQVQSCVSFSLYGNNPVATFMFQQELEGTNLPCFFIYKIESFILSANITTSHGSQIPRVMKYSQTSVQLSLIVDSDLVANKQYSATLTSISNDSETDHIMTVEFDTYDVQSVSGTAILGGLDLSCTFAEGSQAQSCILHVCGIEKDIPGSCTNITIGRISDDPQTAGQILNLQPGLYTVREVAEVESNGQVTVLKRRNTLELRIPDPSHSMPFTTQENPKIAGDLSYSSHSTAIIVGVIAVFLLLVVGIVLSVIIFAYCWLKLNKQSQYSLQVVYEEPSAWAVSQQQTEPEMEQCPAYGVLSKH